jgi:mannose-6-phosphate isomerase-like protein (cupin superfamily)
MEQFSLADVQRQRAASDNPYVEFLRVPAMSAGVYELGAGAEDHQQPHTEDELYYVVSGKATLLVDENDVPVEAGSLVYVPARVVHRFHTITEALTVLVFVAPAEYTNRDADAMPRS